MAPVLYSNPNPNPNSEHSLHPKPMPKAEHASCAETEAEWLAQIEALDAKLQALQVVWIRVRLTSRPDQRTQAEQTAGCE